MSKSPNLRPGLCLDFKHNRIRIHKPTLHILGDPTRILLLVNPKKGLIGIKKAALNDSCSHRVCEKHFDTDECYELHSRILMENLIKIHKGWSSDGSYRIYGKYDSKKLCTVFKAKDSVRLEEPISKA